MTFTRCHLLMDNTYIGGMIMDFLGKIHEKEIQQKEEKIKALDDGTVKGLILSGNYYNIGSTVIVQVNSNELLYASSNDYEFTEYIKDISTYGFTWKDVDEYISNVVTVCRRKVKKDKILICSLLDTYFERMSGQAFTNEKIYAFDDGKLQYIITYDEIDDADFEEDAVILKLTGGQEIRLYCDESGQGSRYSKNLFNFIMDIKDRLDEQ